MLPSTRGRLEIHAAAVLWGLTGPIGKVLEDVPAVFIVSFRTLVGGAVLLAIVYIAGDSLRIRWRCDGLKLLAIGLLLAVHWWFFFKAVQVSTVATGLLALATIPVMVAFLEPLFFRRKLRKIDLATGALVIAGMALMIEQYDLSNDMTQGVVYGLLAAATAALFTVLNKQILPDYSAMSIAFYNLAIAGVATLPFAWSGVGVVTWYEWLLLILLALLCTAGSHALFLRGMRYVEAHYATIVGCLEPIYGTLFAALFLFEYPALRTLAGGSLILLATWLATVISVRRERMEAAEAPGALVGDSEVG